MTEKLNEVKMSFANYQEKIDSQLEGLDKLINIFKEISRVEQEYSKSLLRVINTIPENNYESRKELEEYLYYNLKNSLSELYHLHCSHSSNIQELIIKPLNNFYEKHLDFYPFHSFCINENYLKVISQNFARKNNSFLNEAKKAEQLIVDYEFSNSKSEKDKNNANSFLKKAVQTEKSCLDELAKANITYSNIVDKFGELIEKAKNYNIEYITVLNQVFNQYYTSLLIIGKNQTTNIDQQINFINSTTNGHLQKEQSSEIFNILSNLPRKIKFKKYKLNILKREDLSLNDEKFLNVINTFKENFKGIGQQYNKIFDRDKYIFYKQINEILYSNEKVLSDEFESLIIKLNTNKSYRDDLISYLNVNREKGNFKISAINYDYILKIFEDVVNNFEKDKDFEIIRVLLMMSQTYYFYKENTKVYIHNSFKKLKFFKDIDFWKSFLEYSIQEDIKGKNYSQKIINSIYVSQIVAMGNNMLDCSVPRDSILDFVHFYFKEFKLEEKEQKNVIDILEGRMNPHENTGFKYCSGYSQTLNTFEI